MITRCYEGRWGVVLGGSSGFGLATAQKLAEHGMNLCLVHRDRRSALRRIEPEFEKIRGQGVRLLTFNVDALSPQRRSEVLDQLTSAIQSGSRASAEGARSEPKASEGRAPARVAEGARSEPKASEVGRVRFLLHSIAFGNLKLIAAEKRRNADPDPRAALAERLGVDARQLGEAVDELFAEGCSDLHSIASPPEYPSRSLLDADDFSRTIHCMGTSLLDWTQDLLERGLFAADARVFGLTSEGNSVAWKGYAAVAAAKVALESVARSIAVEMAPYGIRCNVVQAGVTETPALAAIPGSDHLKAQARSRNPFGRLTTPRDVANALYLLSRDEAAWINGEVIRVDGGEHVSGVTS